MIDIKERFKIRYLDALVKITNYMIANFAQEVNYSGLVINGEQLTANDQ